MAKLVIRSGQNIGTEFKIAGERTVMGRRSACTIPIVDPKASREHAVIIRKEKDFFLQDLSRNGTWLNERPASKTEDGTLLKYGDRIKIGETVLVMEDEDSPPVPERPIEIPGYTIMEKLGSGGMGTVYRARQLSMDRIVALKVLIERYSQNSEFKDRFIKEARAAGKLNHPNVIHVHDISNANGRYYFSMEYVNGASVKEMLRKEKRIEVNKALDIVLQAAKALEFAHENHIVHRDVKPDNIMLTKEGIVKLADLGIAKTFEESAPAAKEHRRVMGTPHYMAPEQALGKSIDHRVDIYSLGATFYHMVTGTTPFSGSTSHEILRAHVQESLPAIQDLNPNVPDPVCFIIERMMAKLPEKRYPDMGKVIADIERVQSGGVEGIARIDAGDSTIMRAADEKIEKDKKKDKSDKKAQPAKIIAERDEDEDEEDDAEKSTGEQKPVSRAGLTIGLAVAFAATIGAVLLLSKALTGNSGPAEKEKENEISRNGSGKINSRSNPEAKRLLDNGIAAKERNDASEYERFLKEVKTRFPASAEADEAVKLLNSFEKDLRDSDRKRVEGIIAEARKFEEQNSADLAGCLKKYRAVTDTAGAQPDLMKEAKAKVAIYTKKLDDERIRNTEAAFRSAFDASGTAKTNFDYDAGRAAIQGFLDKFPDAPQKSEAQQALDAMNKEAKARFTEVQQTTEKMEVPLAIAEWSKYETQVKDSATKEGIATAKQALEAKAQQMMGDDLGKVTEAAKRFNYADAIGIARNLQRKLSGMNYADIAKAKVESLQVQKTLHDKVVALMDEKLKSGPIPLGFPVETRFGKVKWVISKADNDHVDLDAVPSKSAPGLTKRFGDFSAMEQYQLYIQVLPERLTADDHKMLKVFCAERGLADKAAYHDEKSSGPQ